jgi:GntR family transcriptional regulator / MocR family aminotransferase
MTGRKFTFDLILSPRPAGMPAFHWLRNSLRAEILSGRLSAGSRLPATRNFARQYQLSRGTILAAMNELQAEGYLETRRGSGTYISKMLPERLLQPERAAPPEASSKSVAGLRLSDFAKRVRPFSHGISPHSTAFRTNLPALDLFPTTLWAQVAARRLRGISTRLLLGCEPLGYLPLREAVAQYARNSRGVNCDAGQVAIVSGIQEALDLVARLLLNPGDKVLMEDPGYQVAYAVFRAVGARLVPALLDDQGAAPKEKDFRSCRLLYVTPGHQYPMGMTMSLRRRLELLGWAAKYGTTIFEDDYDSEFRFSGRPIPAMQGLDRNGTVIFGGSFNKVLFPSLRLGYVILPPKLIEAFASTRAMITRHHPILDQLVLCDFMEQGHFARHIRRMRKIYDERLAILLERARLHLGEDLAMTNIEAGLQTTGFLLNGLTAESVAQAAAIQNIDVVPIGRYSCSSSVPEILQIGFAAVDEQQIDVGVRKLAEIFRSLKSKSRT